MRLGGLNIKSFGLAFGAVGLSWFYGRLFPALGSGVMLGLLMIPWIVLYAITFTRVSPCGPRCFRIVLLGVAGMYLALVVGAEIIQLLLHLPADGAYPLSVARAFMYFGCLTLIPVVRAYRQVQQAERDGAA